MDRSLIASPGWLQGGLPETIYLIDPKYQDMIGYQKVLVYFGQS